MPILSRVCNYWLREETGWEMFGAGYDIMIRDVLGACGFTGGHSVIKFLS